MKEVLIKLIRKKLYDEKHKNLSSIVRFDTRLKRLHDEFVAANKKLVKAEKVFESHCDSLGIKWNEYKKRYEAFTHQLLPNKDIKDLNLMDRLSSLNKIKEAKAIKDKLIKKYRLDV